MALLCDNPSRSQTSSWLGDDRGHEVLQSTLSPCYSSPKLVEGLVSVHLALLEATILVPHRTSWYLRFLISRDFGS